MPTDAPDKPPGLYLLSVGADAHAEDKALVADTLRECIEAASGMGATDVVVVLRSPEGAVELLGHWADAVTCLGMLRYADHEAAAMLLGAAEGYGED